MTDQLRPGDEDPTGIDGQGELPGSRTADEATGGDDIIRSGARADRGAIAAAMPAADFDQRASEAQNDEKEADQEPEGDAALPPTTD